MPLAAQRFIELAGAGSRFVPFLFERRFQFLSANFFLAQIFHLQRQLLAGGFEVGLFLKQRAVLLVQRDRSLARQRHFLHEPLLGGLRAGKALGHRAKCFALRHHLLLQRLEIAAQLSEPLGRACGFGFRVGAGAKRFGVFVARLLARDCAPLPLPGAAMQSPAVRRRAAAPRAGAPRAPDRAVCVAPTNDFSASMCLRDRRRQLQLLLSAIAIFDARHFRLLLLSHAIQPHRFRFVLAQFALQRQRPRFALASAGNHSAVIASAIRRQKIAVRIFVRHCLGAAPRFHQVCRTKSRQKMLCRRAERVAEIHQPVQPRDHARSHRQGSVHFGCLNVQLAQRIHEKCSAPAHLVAQQGNARARLVERFHDHILQFIAQELFDRAFILFLHFGVIGQQTNRVESLRLSLAASR